MGKWANDDGLDAALGWYANSDRMLLCPSQPTTYAEATSSALGGVSMTRGTSGGDYSLSNGTSGRRLTVAAQSGVPVDASGDATHVALVDTTASVLRYVTTCPTQAVVLGGTADVGAWTVDIADPA